MIKKIKILLAVIVVAVTCAAFAACTDGQSVLDGYDVCVYYNYNGGDCGASSDTTVFHGYILDNDGKNTADEDGVYRIKLSDPSANNKPIKTGMFFAGWYKTRTAVTDEGSKIWDDDGNELTAVGDNYYVAGTEDSEEPQKSEPSAYTYSDRWDFDNDVIECTGEETEQVTLTLYAGWVDYFEFVFMYKDESGTWTEYDAVELTDYTGISDESSTADVAYMPRWTSGEAAMTYTFDNFTFPKISGKSFVTAYEDEACTQEIEDSVKHGGTVDWTTASAVNPTHYIYVTFKDYEEFRITSAEQLSKNVSLSGHYTIYNNLDFSEATWPAAFIRGEFTGEFVSASGETVTISNITAKLAGSSSITRIGLFGKVGATAKISGIAFENATVFVSSTANRQNVDIGLFSGEISDGANVSVTVSGALRLGSLAGNATHTVNMVVASGSTEGVTVGESGIKLQFYGEKLVGEYKFAVDYTQVTIADDGTVTLKLTSYILTSDDELTEYDDQIQDFKIQDQTYYYGGNNND